MSQSLLYRCLQSLLNYNNIFVLERSKLEKRVEGVGILVSLNVSLDSLDERLKCVGEVLLSYFWFWSSSFHFKEDLEKLKFLAYNLTGLLLLE